jgi:hypothetical protein
VQGRAPGRSGRPSPAISLGYYSACFKTKNRIANNTNTWTNQGAAGWLSITTNGQTNTLHGYTGDSVWAELRSETSTSYPPTASAAAHVRGRRCDERLSVAFLRQVIEYAAVVSVIDKRLQPSPPATGKIPVLHLFLWQLCIPIMHHALSL